MNKSRKSAHRLAHRRSEGSPMCRMGPGHLGNPTLCVTMLVSMSVNVGSRVAPTFGKAQMS
eukprot:7953466-Karenia_brevis.AAC.1